jgi:putative ubiquitin-RnfH superfamily antitoxin RatB of RatAB toxin-antitoxin module
VSAAETLTIEVIYALPLRQDATTMHLPQGATVEHAIARSGVLQRHPQIDLQTNRIAIFGKLVLLGAILEDRDRIEILRPLQVDPKEARRRRASHRARAGSDTRR